MAQKGKPNVGIIVAVVLAIVVLGGWAFISLKDRSSGGPVTPDYTASVVGATVVAGKPAKNTVDVYEDFLCPYCGRFEARDGDKIIQAINDGKIQVVYHPVAILNQHTTPTGYSLRAANAGLCAAAAGIFPTYHRKLFAEQPAEGSAGLTNQELIAKAHQLGDVPADFAKCVSSTKYQTGVTQETLRAAKNATIRAPGADSFGTPTITVNGKWVDVSDDSWLTDLTNAAS
ncbi:MAG TPA: thioredoxin domain-containing protein [Pseudonocardia sp.]